MGAVNSLAFPAPRVPVEFYADELQRRPDLLELTTAAGEKIPAVHVRHPSTDRTKRHTIIYSHGNAEDIGLHLDYIDRLSAVTRCDVFSYEYVGYSLSRLAGATPSESGCNRSAAAAWRYCVDTLGIPPSSIILFGRSIGSGPTVELASSTKITGSCGSPLDAAAVVLMSPIESGARAVLGRTASIIGYPLDIFRNYEKIHRIRAPTAIMHGTADRVVPCDNGRRLHSWLQNPVEPLWIEDRGHNDMPEALCFEYVTKLIASL